MLVLGLTSLGHFSQVNVSSPFRLPDPPELLSRSAQDIQFVSGLLVSDGYAHFMFGAGDCVAGLLRVHSQIKSVMDGASRWHVSRNTVLQIQKGERVVRLEGPVRSTESFAQVNRHILQAALSHDSVSQVQAPIVHAMDTSSRYFLSRYEATCNELPGVEHLYLNQIMETTLMRSNRQNALSLLHASVTIRNSWPPQFMPPLRGQVALYFPWEFYHIPIEFVLAMQALKGEIWVPTSFVKEGLVQSGVPNHKVVVVPHGHGDYDSGSPIPLTSVDNQAKSTNRTAQARINAQAQISALVRTTCGQDNAFVFLYIGGLLFRKSPIEVFSAFTSAFDRNESACLVMSSSYGDDEAWSDLVALYERALHISWFPLSRVRNADYLTLRVAQTELSKRQARIRCVSDTQCAAVCLTSSGTDILYKSWDHSPQMGGVCKDFCQRTNESARIKCRWSTCSGCGVCSGRIVSEYHAALWDHATVGQCISKRGATNEDVKRPKVLILDGALTTAEKQELFSLSGALVHPSRSEGFGLSVAEAMASGLPVITVDSGATADFTSHETAWLVPAKLVQCLQYPCDASGAWRIFGKPMGQPPMWLEFDVARLGAVMRVVMENQDVAANKAAQARAYILEHFSWDRVHKIIRQRIAKLAEITQLTEELSQKIVELRPRLGSSLAGAPSTLLTWQHAL
jgi:glycosyltransferase involved in cell wall biosynthesis